MNFTLILGTRVVILALIFYSIGIITEQRKRRVTNLVLSALTLGVTLDVLATVFMIIGSTNSPFTLHGFLGYSALAVMLIETFFIWRARLRIGAVVAVSRSLHLYSRIAYIWWVIAFVSGSFLVFLK